MSQRFESRQQAALANPAKHQRLQDFGSRIFVLQRQLHESANDEERRALSEELDETLGQYLEIWHEMYDPVYLPMFDEDPVTTWGLICAALVTGRKGLHEHKPFIMKMLQSTLDTSEFPGSFRRFIATSFGRH